MSRLATRLGLVAPSPTMAVAAEADKLKRAGTPVLDFSIGEPDLPSPDAVKEGLIAFRIAAHIADTVKYGQDAVDRTVAERRAVLDREGQIRCALDPVRARQLADDGKECTMCGKFCAIKIMREFGQPADLNP